MQLARTDALVIESVKRAMYFNKQIPATEMTSFRTSEMKTFRTSEVNKCYKFQNQ